jgi:hypothetical protein
MGGRAGAVDGRAGVESTTTCTRRALGQPTLLPTRRITCFRIYLPSSTGAVYLRARRLAASLPTPRAFMRMSLGACPRVCIHICNFTLARTSINIQHWSMRTRMHVYLGISAWRSGPAGLTHSLRHSLYPRPQSLTAPCVAGTRASRIS